MHTCVLSYLPRQQNEQKLNNLKIKAMKTNNSNTAKTMNNAKATTTAKKPEAAKTVKTAPAKAKAKAAPVTTPVQPEAAPVAVETKVIVLLPQHATPEPEAEPKAPEEQPAGDATAPESTPEPEEPQISERDDMTGQQTVMLQLKALRTSSYNPRKSYSKQGIEELAATMNEVGLLQPIHVRLVGEHYEIIFGERRYRAAQSLKWKQIRAYIRVVSDEVARDMALTENLQREDMPPMDEAVAYLEKVNEGKEIKALAAKYGKSERYIYDRLKLNDLVPQIADLLNRNLIGIGVALEISKCERHIQEDMYERQLKGESEHDDNPAYGWRGKGVMDFKDLIRRTYTTDLEQYHFDKTDCLKCAHNTNTYDLFANCNGKCGHCTDSDCLSAKNEAFVLAKATALLKENPRAILGKDSYGRQEKVVEQLVAQGYEAKGIGYDSCNFPTMPTAPDKERFDDPEQFAEAEQRYTKDLERYEEQTARINDMIDKGNARAYVYSIGKDVQLRYKTVKRRDGEQDFVKRLTEQKAANIAKAAAKIVEETREILNKNVEPATPFSVLEENMLFFIMIPALKPEHRKAIDKDLYEHGYISSEKRLAIIKNLTPEQKTMIRRDYISAYLYANANGDKITGQMLCEYANMHHPEKFGITKARIEEECENKNNRLDERIAEFTAKETVRAAAAEKKAAKSVELKKEDKPKAKKLTAKQVKKAA